MSSRTGGQVELLLWATAEARRLRAEPKRTVTRSPFLPAATTLTMPPEQFTTEWQTVCVAEPLS